MALPAMLIPAIAGGLISIAGSMVARVVVALGLGLVSYTGINAGLDYFKSTFAGAMSGSATLAGICGTLKLDVVLSIFVAAGLARLAIAGATSGTMKKLVHK